MRLALLSLTAAAAVATAAFAQDVPAPAAPPAAMPAPAMPAPAADPMATPAPAADPMAAPAPPADPMAAPAAPAPAPEPPPQELAPMPTDPMTLTIIDTIEKVCKPAVAGGDIPALAKANGFRLSRRMWTKALPEKPQQIVVQLKSSANPTTCTLTIQHAVDGAQTIVSGLHAWASRQDPILQVRSPYAMDYPTMKRTTVSWETTVAGPFTGMSFAMMKKLNGQPLLKGADQAELLYQTRPQ